MANLGRVAVLMGGNSSEREVSLMSGSGVLQALLAEGVDARAFDPARRPMAELANFDRAFIAMHGRMGEDGNMQGFLNCLGVPYTGPGVTASAIAFDKELTKTVWRRAGIPVPEGALVTAKTTRQEFERMLARWGQAGVVVKPARDGSSIGVTKLSHPTVQELEKAVVHALTFSSDVLVEEYIHGREFTVAILDGKALPVIEIKAPEGSYDFQNKYYTDDVQYECPARLSAQETAQIQAHCEKAFAALGARGWSRIDVLRGQDGRIVLLEMNTAPGMTPHSLVPMAARNVGMSYGALCVRLLRLAAKDL